MTESFYEKDLTEKQIDKKIILKLLKYIKPYRRLLGLTILLLLFTAGLEILGPFLLKITISFFDKNPVGRIMTRVTTDVQTLNEMLSSGIVTLFGDVFMILGIMVMLLFLNWKLSLITFSVLILLAIATFIFR